MWKFIGTTVPLANVVLMSTGKFNALFIDVDIFHLFLFLVNLNENTFALT